MSFMQKLGRIVPRECGGASSSLRGALATKQSSFLFAAPWIASLALAMTTTIVVTRERG
jgi:hypothetical protein